MEVPQFALRAIELDGDPAAVIGAGSSRDRPGFLRLLASVGINALIADTAATDRGIKERSLYVTRRVHGPAVLVEGGFVSHPAEARLLGDPTYRQKLADSIAAGIMHYLEASRRPPDAGAVAAAHAGG